MQLLCQWRAFERLGLTIQGQSNMKGRWNCGFSEVVLKKPRQSCAGKKHFIFGKLSFKGKCCSLRLTLHDGGTVAEAGNLVPLFPQPSNSIPLILHSQLTTKDSYITHYIFNLRKAVPLWSLQIWIINDAQHHMDFLKACLNCPIWLLLICLFNGIFSFVWLWKLHKHFPKHS